MLWLHHHPHPKHYAHEIQDMGRRWRFLATQSLLGPADEEVRLLPLVVHLTTGARGGHWKSPELDVAPGGRARAVLHAGCSSLVKDMMKACWPQNQIYMNLRRGHIEWRRVRTRLPSWQATSRAHPKGSRGKKLGEDNPMEQAWTHTVDLRHVFIHMHPTINEFIA